MKNQIQKELYDKHKGLSFLEFARVISDEAKESGLWKDLVKKKDRT